MKKTAFPSLSVTLILIIAAVGGIAGNPHQPFWIAFKVVYLVFIFAVIAANLVGFFVKFKRSRSDGTKATGHPAKHGSGSVQDTTMPPEDP